MKLKLLAPLMMACCGAAYADAAAPAAAESWAAKMTDPTQNAAAFKDPRTFVQWSQAMTSPAMMPAMGMVMVDPGTYSRMAYGMMSPGAFQNYAQFADPNMAMRWMGAGMDPNFYMGMATPMMNPNMATQWMMAPMDPRMLNAGIQMVNPATYNQWMTVPSDPKIMGLMTAPMNPQLYGNWATVVADPRTYPATQGFAQQVQMPAAGAASVPSTTPAK